MSLKYIYDHNESHRVLPEGDAPTQLTVNDEKATSKTYTAGLDSIGPEPSGKLEAQIQKSDKISYEGPTTAWREGLSYELYEPRE